MADTAPTCVTAPGGLRVRYRAENNALDHAGNYDGVAIGTSYGPGKYSMAFQFPGSNAQAISIDDQELLWPAFSFTIEAWIRTDAGLSSSAAVVCKYECGGSSCVNGSPLFCLRLEAGKPTFLLRADGAATVTTLAASSSPVDDGAWHHLVAVRDGSAKTTSLYVDGLLAIAANPPDEQFAPMTDHDGEVDPVTIGSMTTPSANLYTYEFKGWIDEVAIYHVPLTSEQVSAIYDAPDGKCL